MTPAADDGSAGRRRLESNMYSHILVALDGSDTATHALDAALQLAAETGAELDPLYVIDSPVFAFDAPGYDPALLLDAFRAEGERVTAAAQALMTARGVKGRPRVVEVDPPGEGVAHCIGRDARECHADLIVMGAHGRRGVTRMMLGSVAERVLRLAPCPVLMIPARATVSTPASTGTTEDTR
jgi:nucleotide-binding universal stress UspA family protein